MEIQSSMFHGMGLGIENIKYQSITAPLRYGVGSANINSSAINNQCAFIQVSASNPPQRKAAERYR